MKSPGKIEFLFISIAVLFFSTVLIHADALPGSDAPEGFPNGCIDCHSDTDDNDYRINAALSRFENHPSVTNMVKNIPTDCLMCHGEDSYGGELEGLIHEIHLESQDDNGFANNYGANCLACHSDYPQPGNSLIKSGAKNW